LISLDKKEQENKKIEKANLDMVLQIVEENDKLKILNMVKNIIIALLVGFIAIPYLFPESVDEESLSIVKEAWSMTIDTMHLLISGFAPIFAVMALLASVPLIVRLFR